MSLCCCTCCRKTLAQLKILIGCFPPVPLLYRWKHFEVAASYCLRGLICNRILLDVLLKLFKKTGPEIEQLARDINMDADDADESFANLQQVRVCKTVLLLQDACVDDAWK